MPEVHNQISDGGTTGYSAAEFPLLYYIWAFLWKIFGLHEFIPRLLNIILAFYGLYSLFAFCSKILDVKWAYLISTLFFTSPIVVFYTCNFLPDVSAWAFVLVSINSFYCFYTYKKPYHLYLFMVLSLLACLLKITLGIFFISVLIIFFLEQFKQVKFTASGKIFYSPLKTFFYFISIIILIVSWYLYASYFNSIHGGYYSESSISPIWELNGDQISEVVRWFRNIVFHQFFSPYTTCIFLLIFLVILIMWNRVNKLLRTITILLFAGMIIYIILWFGVWNGHDYYMFPWLLFCIYAAITFLHLMKQKYPFIFYSGKIKFILWLFVLYNVWYCGNNIRMKYDIASDRLTATETEYKFWCWTNNDFIDRISAYGHIESHNRKSGIKKGDKVISIPDESINITLYLMNQPGWTNFGAGNEYLQKGEGIKEKIKLGAKYLFLNDTSFCKEPSLQPYLKKKLLTYKNVNVYDLRSLNN